MCDVRFKILNTIPIPVSYIIYMPSVKWQDSVKLNRRHVLSNRPLRCQKILNYDQKLAQDGMKKLFLKS